MTWTVRGWTKLRRALDSGSPRGVRGHARAENLTWIVADHAAHVVLRKAVVEELAGKYTKAFIRIWRRHLAQIGGQDGAGGADFADIGVHLLPRNFPRVGRREAALEEDAQPGQFLLLCDRQQRRGELRMGD